MKYILLAVAVFCNAVYAGKPIPSEEFFDKANRLATWIAENSEFAPMEKHPAYIFLSPEEIQYLYFQGSPSGYTGDEQATITAVYTDGIMFLSEDFDLETDAYILVHELVHHLQYEQEVHYECIQASERPAYRIHNKFVAETGTGVAADGLWLIIATSCPQPY